jgi:hypothetical protein
MNDRTGPAQPPPAGDETASAAPGTGNQGLRPQRIPRLGEDWLSLWIGLAVFLLSLGPLMGVDLLGFGAKVGTWTELSHAITPVATSCAWLPAWLAVGSTYLFLGILLGAGNWLLGGSLRKFAWAFTLMFLNCFTFFSIGVLSNFRKLWEEGIGRLVAVYAVGLFGFIIWFGLVISWMFFGGVHPPLAHP